MTQPLKIGTSLVDWKWPNLTAANAEVISNDDPYYNCAAFAAGDEKRRWWPVDPTIAPGYYWPEGFNLDESTETILATFEKHLGYERCETGDFEEGYIKVAVYELGGEPKHVCVQLPNGKWKSKLGVLQDIVHETLSALSGPFYGKAVRFLRKRMPIV